MFKKVVIVVLLITGSAFAQGTADSLTREDVVRLTLANQPQIVQAQHNLAAAEALVDISRAALSPDVSLAGVYMRLDPVSKIRTGGSTTKLFPNDNYDVHLGAEMTLYDFGRKRTAIAAAVAARQLVGDNLDQVRLTLAYDAIAAFNAVLILQNTMAVIDSQLIALRQHAAVSAKKIQSGTATTYDTLTTQVRIAVATNDRADMERALSSQFITLRELTGLPESQPLSLKGDFAPVSPTPSLDSLLTAAEKQRPELVVAHDAERAAETRLQLADLGDRPSFSLAATSGVKNGYFTDLAEPRLNWSAGLLFRVPLFNGHRTRYERAAAEADYEAAKAHTADVRRKIAADVRQAFLNVQTSLRKIATSDVQIRQAERAVAMANTRYDAGVITNVEQLDAQTALLQTRLIRLRALYDYTVGLASVDKATGRKLW